MSGPDGCSGTLDVPFSHPTCNVSAVLYVLYQRNKLFFSFLNRSEPVGFWWEGRAADPSGFSGPLSVVCCPNQGDPREARTLGPPPPDLAAGLRQLTTSACWARAEILGAWSGENQGSAS